MNVVGSFFNMIVGLIAGIILSFTGSSSIPPQPSTQPVPPVRTTLPTTVHPQSGAAQKTGFTFSATPTSGPPPLSVTFVFSNAVSNDQSGPSPELPTVSLIIHFGDGASGVMDVPQVTSSKTCDGTSGICNSYETSVWSVSHTYRSPGTYIATLLENQGSSLSSPLGTTTVMVSHG